MHISEGRSRFTSGLVAQALVCGLVALVAGCSGGGGKHAAISGAVTLNGQPLASGTITFQSSSGGLAAVGTITDGKYNIPGSEGPLPGHQTVRILAFRDGPQAAPAGVETSAPMSSQASQPVKEQYLPPEYNTASKLTANLVANKNENVDFKLETK